MAKLTDDQIQFLTSHDIPLSLVFDATGIPRVKYRELMAINGYLIAYGVSPCAAYGHTLKTRSGHCPQCRPAGIAYLKRDARKAFVYIAYSQSAGLTKVGLAKDPVDRIRNLRTYLYGGEGDWQLHTFSHADEAGRVEREIHARLNVHRVEGLTYYKDDRLIDCRELFDCPPEVPAEILLSITRVEIDPPSEIESLNILLSDIAGSLFEHDDQCKVTAKNVQQFRDEVESQLLGLDESTQAAVRSQYGIGASKAGTIGEIALLLGVSRVTAKKRINKGLARLRHPSYFEKLKAALT